MRISNQIFQVSAGLISLDGCDERRPKSPDVLNKRLKLLLRPSSLITRRCGRGGKMMPRHSKGEAVASEARTVGRAPGIPHQRSDEVFRFGAKATTELLMVKAMKGIKE